MKKIILSILIITTAFVACKKDEETKLTDVVITTTDTTTVVTTPTDTTVISTTGEANIIIIDSTISEDSGKVRVTITLKNTGSIAGGDVWVTNYCSKNGVIIDSVILSFTPITAGSSQTKTDKYASYNKISWLKYEGNESDFTFTNRVRWTDWAWYN